MTMSDFGTEGPVPETNGGTPELHPSGGEDAAAEAARAADEVAPEDGTAVPPAPIENTEVTQDGQGNLVPDAGSESTPSAPEATPTPEATPGAGTASGVGDASASASAPQGGEGGQ